MKKYTKFISKQNAYLRKRIARTRAKAGFVGILYLIATILLAGMAALLPVIVPTVGDNTVNLGALEFWKVFQAPDTTSVSGILTLAIAALYGLMLLGIVINVFRAFAQLNWLFKKKVSKTYGFNRNVYAMQELGYRFAGNFASILSFNFLIWVVASDATLAPVTLVAGLESLYNIYLILAVALVFHFFLGLTGGKISLFYEEGVGVVEQKRIVGRFAPFVRNLLQIVAVGAIMYFFIEVNSVHSFIQMCLPIANEAGEAEIEVLKMVQDGKIMDLIPYVLEVLTIIWIFVLVKHATSITEYRPEGTDAYGMKNYGLFSFFTVLTMGGCLALNVLNAGAFDINDPWTLNVVIIVAVALVMVIVEIAMHNAPALPDAKIEKAARKENEQMVSNIVERTVDAANEESDEMDLDYYIAQHHAARTSYGYLSPENTSCRYY